ncbi:MAG: DUF6291 domain-containing protein [Treponema sp.]|nr:DUF6291 domain-containing protein [Treponema sp.]
MNENINPSEGYIADSEEHEIVTLTLFKQWHETAEKCGLSDEQYGKIVRALSNYAYYSIKTEFNGIERAMFDLSLPYIDASNKRKIEGSIGGKKARGNSGPPKGNQNALKKKD